MVASLPPAGNFSIVGYQGYLAHHHDMIVARAVEESRRAAEDTTHVRQREWEVDSWRKSKKVCILRGCWF